MSSPVIPPVTESPASSAPRTTTFTDAPDNRWRDVMGYGKEVSWQPSVLPLNSEHIDPHRGGPFVLYRTTKDGGEGSKTSKKASKASPKTDSRRDSQDEKISVTIPPKSGGSSTPSPGRGGSFRVLERAPSIALLAGQIVSAPSSPTQTQHGTSNVPGTSSLRRKPEDGTKTSHDSQDSPTSGPTEMEQSRVSSPWTGVLKASESGPSDGAAAPDTTTGLGTGEATTFFGVLSEETKDVDDDPSS
ncbi:hypothetical protein M231_01881 [Tremella mesenterica]|uniref:Uncharacterized protein n=1 Tax=Tremella mesenterica TaxID=5217 RepID=A0A4Q1BSF9_TREME|nr:hypothetical protein M231_01881 [Tremella mesenterica]